MAKITDLKFVMKGTDYKVPVNVNVSGIFYATLPDEVYRSLGISDKIAEKSLEEVKKVFYAAIERYKKAETTQKVFIAVKYGANGFYQQYENGNYMFPSHGSNYEISTSSFNRVDSLGFSFRIVILETVDGHESWFKAEKGDPNSIFSSQKDEQPDKFYKRSTFHDNTSKKIPYSDEALETLTKARATLRNASEMLFKFIDQDEKQIEAALLKQKLL